MWGIPALYFWERSSNRRKEVNELDAKTLIYALISVLGFGVWGVLMKVGQERLGPLPHLTAMGTAITLIVAVGLASRALPLPAWTPNLWISLAATLATLVAMLFLTLALSQSTGSTAAVVALTALYPGVTALLATLFLGESFSIAKFAGLCFAVVAAFLFTR